MANIDAQAGLARARTHTTNTPGTCLGFVYAAYGSVQSIGPHAGQYPVALNGWLYSTQQHAGDWNPPVGVPVYFGVSPTRTDKNKAAGDVGISIGGGNGFFTDAAGNGRTGVMSLAARAKQTARPYLGWTSDFLGHQLVNIGGAASGAGVSSPFELLGVAYIKALQTQLGVEPDGVVGPVTIKALQTKLGVEPDGVVGPVTIKAIQAYSGANPDGIWGNQTTISVKATLDNGSFTVAPPVVTPPVVVPPANPANRTAGIYVVNKRSQPTTAVATIDPGVQPGVTVTVKSFTHGAAVSGNDVWFRLPDDTWGWSGGFTSASTDGIPEETVDDVPPPTAIPADLVYGIDIAWPQTSVFDWVTVKKNTAFAIIKAAGAETGVYGPADLTDKHLAGVRSVGIRAGFYFFNNGNLPVKDQADKFIEVVKSRIQPGDIVALDVENNGATVPQFTPAQALEFATYVEKALGVKTFMYVNRSTMNNQDWSAVVEAGHPLWLAVLDGLDSSLQTAVKGWAKASITQFVVGPIDGYPASVDRDYSTEAELSKYGFVKLPVDTTGPVVTDPVPVDPSSPLAAQVAELEAEVLTLRNTNTALDEQVTSLISSKADLEVQVTLLSAIIQKIKDAVA
jgi:GH25 family lysozyme M1 (1,4-beta-N-acetylmuramidase)